ncbi:MAG: exodeoxyribonuclease V subunit alpha [Burkholderiales bacterium]|nr:exodeoxyribonuclease V subunit alpha [Burkholderiales bacterium]
MTRAALPLLPAEFAAVLGRLAPAAGEVEILCAALAADATAAGHVCVDLARVAGKRPFEGARDLPPLGELVATLAASPLVAMPGAFAPLVLDGSRLYLHRYWRYESSLAADLLARAAAPVEGVAPERLAAVLDRLFPSSGEGIDMQKVAAAVAVLRRVAVISGGPGTGKTATAARILAALVALSGDRPLAVGLAAPTGKAAARLEAALAAADETRALALRGTTVHRLLGLAGGAAPRFDAANPLPLDVLVVDEASMLDLALAAKLVRALPAAARLVLLGDKDQLASVEAGAVLASVATGAGAFSAQTHDLVARATGEDVRLGAPPSPLADATVLLERSYRFAAASGVGRLARAVRAGDARTAAAILDEGDDAGWQPLDGERLGDAVFAGYEPYFAAVAAGADARACFAALERFRVLCALRGGPFGVEAVNRAVERRLAARDPAVLHRRWYPGRPVMVTRNDYALRLANGDVGIALPDASASGGIAVVFETPEGGLRRLSPARMPECETVYATTVHKSQGSEFDDVLLVLPPEPSPVLSRELVYTGLTRARRRVAVAATPELLAAALATRVERDSGLAERLQRR